jgi:hypothetical protein
MKNNTVVLALIALLTGPVFSPLNAQNSNTANTGKTFTKSFNLDGSQQVRVDLPGVVEVREWDGPSLRFEIAVSLPAGQNAAMLEQLANVGRYNLTSKQESTVMVIEAPNLLRTVKVKGQELKENVSFVVFAPRNVHVDLQAVVSAVPAEKK